MKNANRFIIAAISCLVAMGSGAKSLSPDQALDAACAMINNKTMIKAPAAQMKLVYTKDLQQQPCVYVFANETGFIIASADDSSTPLLGYSDSSTFDPDNIPPSLSWALQIYASTVESQSNKPMPSIKMSPAKAFAAISPIVKTSWGQDAPYNDLCPSFNGTKAVTGCVATAVAQVMKVYEYPDCGTGDKSYNYTFNYQNYTASADFAANPLEWDQMLDSYYGVDYTPQQAQAVANLMYQVGVASEMYYGTAESGGSGASDMITANCLINQFGYDPAALQYNRIWFTDDEWNDIIYNELNNGRPVLFAGDDGQSGHEFICDGYNGNGYYHMNWGWDGMCDGYFSLDDLNPFTQGIGGNEGGFNYNQSALIGFQPKQPGSSASGLMYIGDIYGNNCKLLTNKKSYSIASDSEIIFTTCWISWALTQINYDFGMKFVYEDGTYEVKYLDSVDLPLCTGFSEISIPISLMPTGSYDVYPVYKTENSDWHESYYNINIGSNYVHFTSDGNTITVTEAETPGEQESEIISTISSITCDGEETDKIVVGKTYDFTWDITADGPYNKNLYLFVADKNLTQLVLISDESVNVNFPEAGTAQYTWSLPIPSDLQPDKYTVGLAYVNNENLYVLDYSYIDVDAEAPVTGSITCEINSITCDSEVTEEYVAGKTYDFAWKITADGSYDNDLYLILTDKEMAKTVFISDKSVNVKFAEAGTGQYTWSLPIPSDIQPGTYIYCLAYEDNDNMSPLDYAYTIDIVAEAPVPGSITCEINSITCDGEVVEEYVAGKTYDFAWKITADGSYDNDLYLILTDKNMTQLVLISDESVNVNFPEAGTAQYTWSLPIPNDIESGTYIYCLAYEDDIYINPLNYAYKIDIVSEVPVSGDIICEINSITCDGKETEEFVAGKTYDFEWEITADGPYDKDLYFILTDKDMTQLIWISDESVNVNFPEAGSVQYTWSLPIPSEIQPGKYVVCLAYDVNNYVYPLDYSYTIEIVDNTPSSIFGELESITFDGSEVEGLKVDNTYDITYLITSSGPYEAETYILVTDSDNDEIVIIGSEPLNITFDQEGSEKYTWRLAIPKDLSLGTYMMAIAHLEDDYFVLDSDLSEIIIVTTVGIQDIEAEKDVQYFNLSGLPVKNPSTGQVLIKLNGTNAEKVVIK